MYYVKAGRTTYFCARGPRFTKLPDDIKKFDYDNEKKWPDSALRFEEKRVRDDPFAMTALAGELDRREGAEAQPPWFDDKDEMLADLELAELDDDEYDDDGPAFMIYEELPSDVQKMIRDLAAVERKDLVLSRRYNGKSYKDIPPDEMEKFMKQASAGERIRSRLMESELADEIPILDPEGIDDMKDMAAQLFFMYSLNRISAEINGKKPNEDLFYAAANMYDFAVVEEIRRRNDEEWNDYDDEDEDWEDDDEDDGDDPLELMARLFSEHIQNADTDDEFVRDLGEITDDFLREKGFDLSTLAGLKAAQKWLEEAKAEEAFWSEGPIDNAIDWHIGEARIAAMLKVVKKRIDEYLKWE